MLKILKLIEVFCIYIYKVMVLFISSFIFCFTSFICLSYYDLTKLSISFCVLPFVSVLNLYNLRFFVRLFSI